MSFASRCGVLIRECADGWEDDMLLPFTIQPLAVLKQIVTMMLAVADRSGNDAMRHLRRFVLMPFEPLTGNSVSVRVYLNPKRASWKEPQNRMNGVSLLMNVKTGESTHSIADIAFPPLGYWAAWTDTPHRPLAEFAALADITHFGQHPWGRTATVWLKMPVKLPVGPVAFHEQYGNGA